MGLFSKLFSKQEKSGAYIPNGVLDEKKQKTYLSSAREYGSMRWLSFNDTEYLINKSITK